MKLTIDGYSHLKQNKYLKWYRSIIINRINFPISKGENHHILPKSMGGSNEKENLVLLTPREHYICHLCLVKFTENKDYYKMLCAINSMSMNTLRKNNFNYNSRLYVILQEKRIEELREWLKKHSPFKDKKIHKKCIEKRTKNGTNIFVTNNPMFNEEYVKKKLEKSSGKYHYLCKKWRYEYSLDFGKTWISIDNDLTTKQICKEVLKCPLSTFNSVIRGRNPRSGPLKDVLVRKIENEN